MLIMYRVLLVLLLFDEYVYHFLITRSNHKAVEKPHYLSVKLNGF